MYDKRQEEADLDKYLTKTITNGLDLYDVITSAKLGVPTYVWFVVLINGCDFVIHRMPVPDEQGPLIAREDVWEIFRFPSRKERAKFNPQIARNRCFREAFLQICNFTFV